MQQIPPSPTSDLHMLRRLAVGRVLAVGLFAAGCAAAGHPVPGLIAFLGGMAVVVPEVLQYFAALSIVGRGGNAGRAAALARGVHMLKLVATVGLATAAVLAVNAAGVGAAGPLVLAGMIMAFAGHLALLRG